MAYQWKLQFNPDKNKQAIQVIFSQKRDTPVHPPLFFSGSEVVIEAEHKHLGMILDSKLSSLSHIKKVIVKAGRDIGIIHFLSKYVTHDVLDQIYKLYVRSHLDYGDIIYYIYDPEFKFDFTKWLESTQYSAAPASSGAWRGTNTDKIYEELGWEILYYRRWYSRLCTFINCKATKDHCTYITKYDKNVLSVTIYEHQTCLNHSQKVLTDLHKLISKIVLENITN